MGSEQLNIDAEALWDHGARHLPAFAETYSGAAQSLYDTANNEAYMRSGEVPPAFKRWIEYRDFLQSNILRETAANLLEVGKALERYAFEVSEMDGDNSDLIEYAQKFYSDMSEEELKEHAEQDAPASPDDVTDKEIPGGDADSYSPTEEAKEQKQQDHMGVQ